MKYEKYNFLTKSVIFVERFLITNSPQIPLTGEVRNSGISQQNIVEMLVKMVVDVALLMLFKKICR